MSRTARLWRGAGFLMLGGLLLPGVPALADDDPPLSQQLTELGRQALDQGAAPTAQTFFQKALKLDPNNKLAAQGLEETKQRQKSVVRVAAMQDPVERKRRRPRLAPPPPRARPAPAATQPADQPPPARPRPARRSSRPRPPSNWRGSSSPTTSSSGSRPPAS